MKYKIKGKLEELKNVLEVKLRVHRNLIYFLWRAQERLSLAQQDLTLKSGSDCPARFHATLLLSLLTYLAR